MKKTILAGLGLAAVMAAPVAMADYSCKPDMLSIETAVVVKTGMATDQFEVVNYDFTPNAFDLSGWISGWVEIEVSPTQSVRVMGLTVRGACSE